MISSYKKFPSAMIIAGSDSISGAGIQADLKTFYEIGIFAGSVITAVTCQNTLEVIDMQITKEDIVKKQIEQIENELDIKIIKTGMLFNSEIIKVVQNYIKESRKILILDPVMISTSGSKLIDDKSIESIIELSKLAFLITPNIPEAEILSGMKINSESDIDKAAKKILKFGCQNLLIKGAHYKESKKFIINRLYKSLSENKIEIKSRKIDKEFHGTGCTLASAISAYLMKNDFDIDKSVKSSIKFIEKRIKNSIFNGLKSSILI